MTYVQIIISIDLFVLILSVYDFSGAFNNIILILIESIGYKEIVRSRSWCCIVRWITSLQIYCPNLEYYPNRFLCHPRRTKFFSHYQMSDKPRHLCGCRLGWRWARRLEFWCQLGASCTRYHALNVWSLLSIFRRSPRRFSIWHWTSNYCL